MLMRIILSLNPPACTLHGLELQAHTMIFGLCGLGIEKIGFINASQLYTSTLFTLFIPIPFICSFSCVPQLKSSQPYIYDTYKYNQSAYIKTLY